MYNRLSFLFAGTLFAVLLFLSCVVSRASTPDSLRMVTENGRDFVEHKVEAKETWIGLSKRYKVTLQQLQQANPGVKTLQIGQLIVVPVAAKPSEVTPVRESVPAAVTNKKATEARSPKPLRHKVAKGETLFSLAKRYGLTVDELKTLNRLKNNDLKVGQDLVVQKATAEPTPTDTGLDNSDVRNQPSPSSPSKNTKEELKNASVSSVKKDDETRLVTERPVATMNKGNDSIKVTATDSENLPTAYEAPGASRTSKIEKDTKTGVTIEKITEVGVASWMESGELNQNKFYALHRTAPVGTIIKVVNRMNNNSVYVKVVGVLPDSGDNANIIIKITQAAAQRIGAIDSRFTSELNYGISR